MAGIATPPPVAPAAPPAPTPPPAAPPTSPAPGAPPAKPNADADPNLAMSQIVSRSRAKNAAAEGKGTETGPNTPPEPAKPASPTSPAPPAKDGEGSPKLMQLLGNALKYGSKGPPKPADGTPKTPPTTPATPATPPVPAAAAAPATPPPAPTKKTARGKKPAQVDTASIAREAATAATEAALRTVQAQAPPAQTPSELDGLTPEDRRDYEIALHLSKIDPRYPDAHQVILDQVRRAEEYAANWEAANPGQTFDPQNEDHDAFFASISRPWSDSEFDDARIDMRAERKIEKLMGQHNETLSKTQAEVARVDLAPVVEQEFVNATGTVAKMLGDDVHDALLKQGWDGLHAKDPVMAQVLGGALHELHPFIEAAVQIDDPRSRIRVDPQNPAHQRWNQVVSVGEASLVGQTDDHGRVFAKRADYVKMTPAQQSQHWYLTRDMIIAGALDYAATQVKSITEDQKNRLQAMGFVRSAPNPAAGNGTAATQTPPVPVPTPTTPAAVKPVSPSVGSGAKIDDSGNAPATKEGALMRQMSAITFRR